MRLSHERAGVALVLLSATGLAFKGTLAKFAYAAGATVVPLIVWRFLLCLPLFWALYLWRGQHRLPPMTRREWWGVGLAGFLGYYLSPLLDFQALYWIDVSLERVLLFTYPAFVMCFEAALSRRLPPPRQWVAFVVVQAGVMLAMHDAPAFSRHEMLGAAFALCAALTFAGYICVNQRMGRTLGSIRFTVWTTTFALGMLLAHGLVTEPRAAFALSDTALFYIGIMAVGSTFLPLLMFSEGVRRIGAARAALLTTVGPVVTMLAAYMLLDERMTWMQVAGAAVVIGGVLVLEGQWPAFFRARPVSAEE